MEVSNAKTSGDSDNGGVRATHITKMSDFRYEQYAQKISGYITEWAYVTQTVNQMKKRLGTASTLWEEKGQWWENITCVIIVRVTFEPNRAAKSLTSFMTFFLRCHKDIANLCRYFRHACPNLSKILISICKRLSCLSGCKTSTSELNSFLRYCKDTAYLLCTFGIPDHTHQKW